MERWDPPFDRDPFSLSLAPNMAASLEFKHRSIMFLPKKKQFLNPFVIFRFTEILSAYCLLSTWLHPFLDASLDELYSGRFILKKEDIF